MKLFRINKVEEFFNSYPKAIGILNEAAKQFSENPDIPPKKITVLNCLNFQTESFNLTFNLQCIVFSGAYELYYYDV